MRSIRFLAAFLAAGVLLSGCGSGGSSGNNNGEVNGSTTFLPAERPGIRGSQSWSPIDLPHQVGRVDGGGWSTNAAQDAPGFMQYGPYTNQIPVGENLAVWDVLIDNNSAANDSVMALDVHDATDGTVLARRDVSRFEFNDAYIYQAFILPFTVPPAHAGHPLEFRVYSKGSAYLRSTRVRSYQYYP